MCCIACWLAGLVGAGRMAGRQGCVVGWVGGGLGWLIDLDHLAGGLVGQAGCG